MLSPRYFLRFDYREGFATQRIGKYLWQQVLCDYCYSLSLLRHFCPDTKRQQQQGRQSNGQTKAERNAMSGKQYMKHLLYSYRQQG
jgi:hypothetical protein